MPNEMPRQMSWGACEQALGQAGNWGEGKAKIPVGDRSSLRTADVSSRSSPLRDVLRGGTSATQRQKFHTDDVNQCLHNKSGSHGVSNANLFNFTFLLVDFGKVWCSSVNELHLNSNASSREDYSPKILAALLEIHHVYI